MKLIENTLHNCECQHCFRGILYGALVYYDRNTGNRYHINCYEAFKYIIDKQLKAEFSLAEIRSEKGEICENTIINGDIVFKLLDSDGGYTYKTIRSMIARHSTELIGKIILLRQSNPDIMTNGRAFPMWGLYLDTGQRVQG